MPMVDFLTTVPLFKARYVSSWRSSKRRGQTGKLKTSSRFWSKSRSSGIVRSTRFAPVRDLTIFFKQTVLLFLAVRADGWIFYEQNRL